MHHVPTVIMDSLAFTFLATSVTDSNAITKIKTSITKTTTMPMLVAATLTTILNAHAMKVAPGMVSMALI